MTPVPNVPIQAVRGKVTVFKKTNTVITIRRRTKNKENLVILVAKSVIFPGTVSFYFSFFSICKRTLLTFLAMGSDTE